MTLLKRHSLHRDNCPALPCYCVNIVVHVEQAGKLAANRNSTGRIGRKADGHMAGHGELDLACTHQVAGCISRSGEAERRQY